MNKKLWGGRFNAETDSNVEAYTASIHFDVELASEDILGSMAHANMLCQCKIISNEENKKIQAGLKAIVHQYTQGNLQFSVADEDIHMNIERLLRETIGDVASKLHTARSRNDQVALDLHLYLRKHILNIVELLTNLQHTLLTLAAKYKTTILPGYTHLQRAQPIYLAQHWCAYVAMFSRDIERLKHNWISTNQSPLGAAALAGTSFTIDRHHVAAQLGFDGIYENTLDAVSDRDFIIEFLSTSTLIMMHISRMSEELILWSSQEFNFISFDERYCTGSSIMPQKKNPDIAELGRGKTGRVYGALITLLTILKGLPLAYNKDLQEDKEPLFDVIKTISQTLALYSPLLNTLTIHGTIMQQAAESGYLNATMLAEYLVKRGMSFRSAHEIVGQIVAHCIQKECKLEDLTLLELQTYCPIIAEDVYQVITIQNAAATCMSATALTNQINKHHEQLELNINWCNDKKNKLNSVYAHLGLT